MWGGGGGCCWGAWWGCCAGQQGGVRGSARPGGEVQAGCMHAWFCSAQCERGKSSRTAYCAQRFAHPASWALAARAAQSQPAAGLKPSPPTPAQSPSRPAELHERIAAPACQPRPRLAPAAHRGPQLAAARDPTALRGNACSAAAQHPYFIGLHLIMNAGSAQRPAGRAPLKHWSSAKHFPSPCGRAAARPGRALLSDTRPPARRVAHSRPRSWPRSGRHAEPQGRRAAARGDHLQEP
jgi:hypothetical protein